VAGASQGYRRLRWAKRFLSFASLPRYERYLASDLSLDAVGYRALFAGGPAYEDTRFYRGQQRSFADESLGYLTRMCLNDTRVFLPEHNLTYADKAGMAAAVEARPPLIDHRVVERMFRLPPRHRIRGRTQKALLKDVAARYLDREIIDRPKASFASPIRAWLRGPLAPMVNDLLSESRVRARGLYRPAEVARLIGRDREGAEDNALTIWMLLTSEIWFQTFF
jgi:asparagine synthase (glutamine-hydrolysing)